MYKFYYWFHHQHACRVANARFRTLYVARGWAPTRDFWRSPTTHWRTFPSIFRTFWISLTLHAQFTKMSEIVSSFVVYLSLWEFYITYFFKYDCCCWRFNVNGHIYQILFSGQQNHWIFSKYQLNLCLELHHISQHKN